MEISAGTYPEAWKYPPAYTRKHGRIRRQSGSSGKAQAMAEKKRSSNIELFRIVLMLLIVLHHYYANSGLRNVIMENPRSFNAMFVLAIGAWGKVCINCFVLITGYFMCRSEATVRKFLKLLLQIEFYQILWFVVFAAAGYTPFSLSGFLYALLPGRSVDKGFVVCFLLFYLLIPLLNAAVRNISRRMHLAAVAVLLLIYTVMGTIPFTSVNFNYVTWFCVVYIIGAYIRFYGGSFRFLNRRTGLRLAFWTALSAATVLVTAWRSPVTGNTAFLYFINDSNKILAVITSVCALLFFRGLRIPYSRIINTVAKGSFGVLLIHAHNGRVRSFLWKKLLRNVRVFRNHPSWVVPHMILGSLAVYLVCTAADLLRIRFAEAPFFRFYDRHAASFEGRLGRIGDRILALLHVPE